MQGHSSSKKRARRKRRKIVYILLNIVLVVAAISLALSLFFKINRIEVTGSTVYSNVDIIAASGISKGDNLFFLDKNAALRGIFEGFPYVAEARLIRRLPNTLIIALTERESLGLVAHDGSYWMIDGTGRILEQSPGRSATEKPIIQGLTLLVPEAGTDAAVPSNQQEQLQALLLILDGLQRYALLPQTSDIDIARAHDLRLHCNEGKLEVFLGDAVDIDIKLSYLLSAIEEMPDSGQWVIDVSNAAAQKRASYYPASAEIFPARDTPNEMPNPDEQDPEEADEKTDEETTDTENEEAE